MFSKVHRNAEVLRTLFEIPLPRDASCYAEYLSKLMLSIGHPIGSNWKIHDTKMSFLELLGMEIKRVRDIPGGQQTIFNLYLSLKLHILQYHETTVPPSWNVQKHLHIDNILDELLQSSGPDGMEVPFFDLAEASRAVRERMLKHPCIINRSTWGGCYILSWPDYPCIHNLCMPLLDTLQRQAYFEIRSSVCIAVGNRLPAELTHLVFEYAMAMEDIPMDPRILVYAEHKDGMYPGRKPRKCRLPCSHDRRGPDSRAGMEWQFVTGDDWIETNLFPHWTAECCADVAEPGIDDRFELDEILKEIYQLEPEKSERKENETTF